MEIAIPLIALSGLYFASNQSSKKEAFTNNKKQLKNENLPNTDITDKNYPNNNVVVKDTDLTSRLSTVNNYSGGSAYTDKYFNPNNNVFIDSSPSGSFTSLTGEQVNSNYFEHNNMVPFFGSNIRNIHTGANNNEGVLDNMAGSGSQYISKVEQGALFAPHENLQFANGAPNNSDFFQSRVNPSLKMSNVKPFAEVMVAPGLGGTQNNGYNSGLFSRDLYMEKNVDQLRVATNPKTVYSQIGYEGPANSYIKKIAGAEIQGEQNKNRPDRHFEMSNDKYLTTVGAEKGPTLRAINQDPLGSRNSTSISYEGSAYYNNGEYVEGEFMPTTRQQLGEVPLSVANAVGRQYATEQDYQKKAFKSYPNNRSSNKKTEYYGGVSNTVASIISPILDVLKPTRKQNTIGTLRPYNNMKPAVTNGYTLNPGDQPKTTIKETTQNSKFHLNVNSKQNGTGYLNSRIQLTPQNRTTTSTDFYGPSSSGSQNVKPRLYDDGYAQRNNDIKSSTISNNYISPGGRMNVLKGDTNIRIKTNRNNDLKNNSIPVPNYPTQNIGQENYGRLQGSNTKNLYQNMELDRNDGSVLNQLNGNPYNHDITKYYS